MPKLIELKPVTAEDADELFPLIFQSRITETILWDGPSSLDEFRAGLKEREKQVREGKTHLFTVIELGTGRKAGSIDIRPYEERFRGDMGLWIGQAFQGKGYATEAIGKIVRYGFGTLKMAKIEAKIFVGNSASRRAFEKNGFTLEGTIRRCTRKRGRWVDEWLLGVLPEDLEVR